MLFSERIGDMDDWMSLERKLRRYHEDVIDAVRRLSHIADFLDENSVENLRASAMTFRDHDLAAHFRLEEEVLFQSILKVRVSMETRVLIAQLTKEHATFLGMFEDFYQQLERIPKGNKPDPVVLAKLRFICKTVGRLFADHAARELDGFSALFRENPSVQFLLSRNYLSYRTKHPKE